jgi:hypothetical protein
MNLTVDAKEVLFHLNYMGYRNISKDQLKSFMLGKLSDIYNNFEFTASLNCTSLDLKKLIKYEVSPRESFVQVGPQSSINIQRLFEAHTLSSETKQNKISTENSKKQQMVKPNPQTSSHIIHRQHQPTVKEVLLAQRPTRVKSADVHVPCRKEERNTKVVPAKKMIVSPEQLRYILLLIFYYI